MTSRAGASHRRVDGLVVAVLLTAAACAGQSNKAGIERLHKVVAAAGPTAATEQETVS